MSNEGNSFTKFALGRALLDWSLDDLAEASGVSREQFGTHRI